MKVKDLLMNAEHYVKVMLHCPGGLDVASTAGKLLNFNHTFGGFMEYAADCDVKGFWISDDTLHIHVDDEEE